MGKVFVLDDDKDMLELMAQSLSPLGWSMASATRLTGALDKVRDAAPDVVLLDVMLPDGAGYQLSRAIRAHPQLYKTPILFVSTMSDGPEIEYALRQGGDTYMAKPFTLKDLVARLQQMKELSLRIAYKNEETRLPGPEAIQKEIDHRIFRRLPFSLCYVSVDNLEPFVLKRGREEGAKFIAWLGGMLRTTIRNCKLYETFLAHLGREHFLTLLDADSYKDYCKGLTSNFDLGVSRFYQDIDFQDGYIITTKKPGTYAGYRLMSLRIDITIWKPDESSFVNAHELFHEINEAHKKSEPGGHRALFRWDQHKKW